MSHPNYGRTARRFAFFLLTVTLLAGCGGGRKKYLAQIIPIVEQNDAIDSRFAQLPRVNAFQDPNYLAKLDGCITSKEAFLSQLESVKPPFLMAATHTKLIQAMKNGVRYLRSEREKFTIAAQKISQMPPAEGSDEMEVIHEYQSQTAAYQADMREQLMKQQYEKLYDDVKDELERARKF